MKKTTENPRAEHATSVGLASVAIFLVIMAVLFWRLEIGNDPAIGAATAQAAPQQVIRRKLIIKRKVIHVIEDRPALPASSPAGAT